LTPVVFTSYNLNGIPKKSYRKEYEENYCGSTALLNWMQGLLTEIIPSDEQVLILVDQKDKAGKVIHKFLKKCGIENTYISGDNKNEEADAVIEAFNEKEIRVLVATGVLGEGIDLKSTQHLILGGGGKSEIKLVQAIGRCVRLYPDKPESYVYDCNFLTTNFMEKHSEIRKNIFENQFSGKIINK